MSTIKTTTTALTFALLTSVGAALTFAPAQAEFDPRTAEELHKSMLEAKSSSTCGEINYFNPDEQSGASLSFSPYKVAEFEGPSFWQLHQSMVEAKAMTPCGDSSHKVSE